VRVGVGSEKPREFSTCASTCWVVLGKAKGKAATDTVGVSSHLQANVFVVTGTNRGA